MVGIITTGNHPKSLWPGIHAWFGMKYAEYPEEYKKLFDVQKSEKNYEEDVKANRFGLMPLKSESAGVTYDSHTQGYTKRYTHNVYGSGYIVTEEELEDNQYEALSKSRAASLAFSGTQTKETVCANVYNRAFNTSYTGGDGKAWVVSDHPSLNGTFSNVISTAADFSQAALEDLLVQISQAVDERGNKINLMAKLLVCPTNIQFDVARVLKSDLQSDNANHAINAVKGIIDSTVNHYLTDTDAWFIRTNCPNGATIFDRRAPTFQRDNDFDTGNAKAKLTMRFSTGWTDPLSLFGSAGA